MSTGLVLGGVGAVIGAYFGVPSLGFSVGYAIGSQYDKETIHGPKLTDLKMQSGSYGAFLPLPFGKARLAGIDIWQTDLEEHTSTSGGKGGGGGGVETTSYTASFDIVFSGLPGRQLLQLYANGRLIKDESKAIGDDLPIIWYEGAEDQLPDPTEQAAIESDEDLVGLTPAYRGLGRMVATDMQMEQFGNAIPNFEAVLGSGSGGEKIRLVKQNNNVQYGQNKIINSWTTDLADDTPLDEPQDMSSAEPIIYLESTSYNCHYRRMNDFLVAMMDDNGALVDQRIELWVDPSLDARDSASQNVAISRRRPILATDHTYIVGENFDYNVGITSGTYPKAACTTRDSRTLYVFTGDEFDDDHISMWHKIKGHTDGTITRVDHGTVDPTVPGHLLGFGNFVVTNASVISSPNEGVMMAETNGKYFWSYYGISDPGPFPPGSALRLWKIADKNFVLVDTIGFDESPGAPSMPVGGVRGSIFSMMNGYAGTIGYSPEQPTDVPHHSFRQTALWTRLSGDDESITVGDFVAEESDLCGASAYDVSELTDQLRGYIVSQLMPGRAAIETLMPVFFFDATEEDGNVVYVKRGSRAPVVIPDDDLAMHDDGTAIPAKLIYGPRKQDVDLPAMVTLNYFNPEADYQFGSQVAQRMATNSELHIVVNVPVVFVDGEAKQRAEALMRSAWTERTPYTWHLPTSKYAKYGPCDVHQVTGINLRITRKRASGNVLTFDGVEHYAPVLDQIGIGGPSTGSPPVQPPAPQDTDLMLLDMPYPLDPARKQTYGAAMAGHDRRVWPGAVLSKSSDGGATYATVATDPGPGDTFGATTSVLGDWDGGNVFDLVNRVTVLVTPGSGTLQSYSRLQALAGQGTYLIGDEIVIAQYAPLVADRTYMLHTMLRYRNGSDMGTKPVHVSGERFCALPVLTMIDAVYAEYGSERLFKATTIGSGGGGGGGGVGPTGPPTGGGTITATFDWSSGGGAYQTLSTGIDTILVIKFTTGNNNNLMADLPWINCYPIGTDTPEQYREGVLSSIPGSFTSALSGESRKSGLSVSFPFEVGTSNYGGFYPVLAKNTTYYLNVRFIAPFFSTVASARILMHIPASML